VKVSANKKILNASPLEWGGIKFKSKLEMMVYRTLLDNGIIAQYEPTKYIIWEGYKPKAKFYDKDKSGALRLNDKKIISITYTPDFVFDLGVLRVFIEVKGMENDVFYIKKKMFRKYLEELTDCIPLYFEIYSKRQLIQAIQLIQAYNKDCMGRIETIKNLLSSLIIKGDTKLASTFLEKRDFLSLKEIVDANVYKAEKTMPGLFNSEIKTTEEEENVYNKLKSLQELVNNFANDFIDPEINE